MTNLQSLYQDYETDSEPHDLCQECYQELDLTNPTVRKIALPPGSHYQFQVYISAACLGCGHMHELAGWLE